MIFDDISRTPVLTHEIWQELLLQLGRQYQHLSTRGGYLISSRPAPVQPSGPDPSAIQVKQADVFRPTTKPKSGLQSTIQSVLDGPIEPTPPQVINAERTVLQVGAKPLKQIEGLLGQGLGKVESTRTGGVIVQTSLGMREEVHQWIGKEWTRRNIRISLPDPEILRWIIDSKSRSRDDAERGSHSSHCYAGSSFRRGGHLWTRPGRSSSNPRSDCPIQISFV